MMSRCEGDSMTDARVPLRVMRLRSEAKLPHRASTAASGLDLYACLPNEGHLDLTAAPIVVPTGVALEFPFGVDLQIRPRSGLSARGVGVTLGTIDADYRGELLVTMFLFGGASHRIEHGDRIAQLVCGWLAPLDLVEVTELTETERGAGGHGSTGRH